MRIPDRAKPLKGGVRAATGGKQSAAVDRLIVAVVHLLLARMRTGRVGLT